MDDSAIAEAIAQRFRWITVIPDTVEAEVRNGVVTLRGQVQWTVTNLITVKPQVERARLIQQGRASRPAARCRGRPERPFQAKATVRTVAGPWDCGRERPNDRSRPDAGSSMQMLPRQGQTL
jgi:hypothetical protein